MEKLKFSKICSFLWMLDKTWESFTTRVRKISYQTGKQNHEKAHQI